jgi:uncharacterized protein (DUF58 family)
LNPREFIRRLTRKIPLPTSRTVWVVGLGTAMTMILGWKRVLLLDGSLMGLCLLDHLLATRGGEIRVSRDCSPRLSQGFPHTVEIHLANPGSVKREVQVRDQTPRSWEAAPVLAGTIPGRSSLKLQYRLVPPQRGKHAFGDLWIRVLGPLGLIRKQMIIPSSTQIQVYPCLKALQSPNLATYRRTARHWGTRPSWKSREGRVFESLRDYVEGDDPRRIHWKATARLDRPIVQDFQAERNQIVMILLDAGRLMTAFSEGKSKLDHALEAAVQLAHTALSGGDRVGLLAFADQVITFVPPSRSPTQLQELLQAVLDLHPVFVESQYERAVLWLHTHVRRRSLVVVYTDLLDEVASEALLAAVRLLRPRHLPLCVAIADSEWGDLLRTSPDRVQGVYERAVLQGLLTQRSKALANMIQKGALALDLPPSRLSGGILERYMEVKTKGLL